jgi:hypothetical protein
VNDVLTREAHRFTDPARHPIGDPVSSGGSVMPVPDIDAAVRVTNRIALTLIYAGIFLLVINTPKGNPNG